MPHPTLGVLVRRVHELTEGISRTWRRHPAGTTWMTRFLQAEAELLSRRDGTKVFQIDNF